MSISYNRAERLSLESPDPEECRECAAYLDMNGDCEECMEIEYAERLLDPSWIVL